MAAQQLRELGSHRLRIRLDGQLLDIGKRGEQPLEGARLGERRRASAEEHRPDVVRQPSTLPFELREQRIDVRAVLIRPTDGCDEVAVTAAMDAEGKVDVQVAGSAGNEVPAPAHRFLSPSRLRTARNASCGTSTPPTCFIRFFPFFCFSRSFRLREMSPP